MLVDLDVIVEAGTAGLPLGEDVGLARQGCEGGRVEIAEQLAPAGAEVGTPPGRAALSGARRFSSLSSSEVVTFLVSTLLMMGRMAMLDDEGLSASVTSGGPRARRRWPVAEKRRIVLESFEAGASVSVVARRHDVNANQVFAWRKLYRDGLLGGGGLVPVRIVADGPAPLAPSPPIGAGRMTIELGCGARVVVDAGVDASALSRVLIALAAR